MSPKRTALMYFCAAVGIVTLVTVVWQVRKFAQADRDSLRRLMSENHLREVGIAMAMYDSGNGRFPARAIFGNGKPLLSWRVQMLPYIEQNGLYEEFHLDEPWDSPHNRSLIAKMPNEYLLPGEDAADGKTHYLAAVGKGMAFDGGTGFGDLEIADGAGNTIFVVEADNAVIWTKPDDLEIDLDDPLNGLGNLRPEGFLAILGDARVKAIPKTIDPKTLKALFTRAGGDDPGPWGTP